MINTLKKLLGMGPSVDYQQLVAEGAVVIDVRSPGEYRSGHAPGSINVPLDKLSDYTQKLKNKDMVIITCCASGMRSASAKSTLINAGYKNVYNGGPWPNLNF